MVSLAILVAGIAIGVVVGGALVSFAILLAAAKGLNW
jgi:hypothetical protein